MVDSLMSQGMVERHQGATDRRAVLVTISQSFLTLATSIEKAQQKAIDELKSVLSEEEARIFDTATEKLYTALLDREGI